MPRLHLVAPLVALCFGAMPLAAADGDLLPNFGTEATLPGHGFYPSPFAANQTDAYVSSAILPDGRLYLFGSLSVAQNSHRAGVYRLAADGYYDLDYGDIGLRTLHPPCSGGRLRDAVVDRHERPWLVFSGCDTIELYRLTVDGDLDLGLNGTGRLSIAFDDLPDVIPLQQGTVALSLTEDGLLIAGRAKIQGETHNRLALAHVDLDGQPVPGFGQQGRAIPATGPLSSSLGTITGVHPLEDGRILISASQHLQVLWQVQMVFRLLPNGALDPGFGNHGPGVSRIDYRPHLGIGAELGKPTPITRRSMLDRDGRLIVVGHLRDWQQPALGHEQFLMRWTRDGQLDVTVGPMGYRLYGYNFGPDDDPYIHNFDEALDLIRQGNGHYLMLGRSRNAAGHYVQTLTRLDRNLNLDTSFGVGGRIHHLAPIAADGQHAMRGERVLLQPGRILTAGVADTGPGALLHMLAAENDLLFADTFD